MYRYADASVVQQAFDEIVLVFYFEERLCEHVKEYQRAKRP